MKLSAVAILLLTVANAQADPVISLYLECKAPKTKCEQLPLANGSKEKMHVEWKPAMSIGPKDIQEAQKQSDPEAPYQLHIKLAEPAAQRFEKLTGDHLSRKLALVVNGRVLIAPVIQSQIPGGKILITTNIHEGYRYLESLPWLKKMVEPQGSSQ